MKKSRRERVSRPLRPSIEVRPAEQILIDALGKMPEGPILCTSIGRGQFAAAAARNRPSARVCCCFLDLSARNLAAEVHSDPQPNLRFECRSDFPEDEFAVFAMPVTAAGDAELVREFLQAGHMRLGIGGTMFVATDNPVDSWLHDELRKKFAKVTRTPTNQGTLFVARKTEPLPKSKNHECQFAFRDEGRLIQAVSRPGVFSHRRVDGGARALLRAATLRPGDRVLELGCGSGVVSLAAAFRADGVQVEALDSNVRAVECTRLGAELNGLSNVSVQLNTAEAGAEGELFAEPFDVVFANPPYYSNYRIAEIFARCAAQSIKPEGMALFVTKQSDWYEERLPELFASVAVEPVGNYRVLRCRGKAAGRIRPRAMQSAAEPGREDDLTLGPDAGEDA
jgi:16S rRNA (guanine1207-N2)-methyltransferase